MGQEAVKHLGFGLRDRLVGLREFLDVVDAGRQGIVVALDGTDAQHVQDDLRVLRVVLVPAVVEGLARTGERERGDQVDGEAGLEEPPGDRAMVVAGGLEGAGDGLAEAGQQRDEAVVLGARVGHAQAAPARLARDLDQDLVAGLGDVDGYEDAGRGRKLVAGGHGRSVSGVRLGTPSL